MITHYSPVFSSPSAIMGTLWKCFSGGSDCKFKLQATIYGTFTHKRSRKASRHVLFRTSFLVSHRRNLNLKMWHVVQYKGYCRFVPWWDETEKEEISKLCQFRWGNFPSSLSATCNETRGYDFDIVHFENRDALSRCDFEERKKS